MTADWQQGGFGVYVHWPFCAAKCPYCDFNSHVRQSIDQERWAQALATEVRRAAELTPDRTVQTVFFGGGTPSLMSPGTVETVMAAIQQGWHLANDAEVSLEANPTSVEAERFAGFARAGVNRVSIGVQALNDADLRALGRMHSVDEALSAFDIARRTFDRVSFDLIYARQGQSLNDWREELSRAVDLAVDHLSLYQLTIESGTRFGDLYARGRLRGLPDEGLAADMYDLTQELTAGAGLNAYEVSNHARPGAESRHNLIYWRYGDYVGVGPGAHGRVTVNGEKCATETPLLPETWLKAAEDGGATSIAEKISAGDQAAECLMMGLRLDEGVSMQRVHAFNPETLDPKGFSTARDLGLIDLQGDRLIATGAGRLVLNRLLAMLLAGTA